MNNDPCSKFTINKKPEFFNNKSIYSSADCKQNKNYRVSNFGFKKHSKNLTETSVKKGKKKYLNERYTFIRKRTLSHLINLMKTLEPAHAKKISSKTEKIENFKQKKIKKFLGPKILQIFPYIRSKFLEKGKIFEFK